jgi:hypothetical protein
VGSHIIQFNLDDIKFVAMNQELQTQIDHLKNTLTGDFMQDMEIRDKIHNLEMELNGVKPSNSEFECVGCGS